MEKVKAEFRQVIGDNFAEINDVFSYGDSFAKFQSAVALAEFLWPLFVFGEQRKINIQYQPQEVSLSECLQIGPLEFLVNGVSVWVFCKLSGHAEMMACFPIVETSYEYNGLGINFLDNENGGENGKIEAATV
ncbi:MAG: hypothetical protein WCT18_02925 [Patescibacteria group bacterium]